MRNKKIENKLIKEILDLTRSFQIEFPAIYDNLLETPLFLNYDHKDISETEFEAYCEFLKAQLRVLEKENELTKGWATKSFKGSIASVILVLVLGQ